MGDSTLARKDLDPVLAGLAKKTECLDDVERGHDNIEDEAGVADLRVGHVEYESADGVVEGSERGTK